MQVTLAMRRLRETVYEVVEGVKQMPGEGGASNESGERLGDGHLIKIWVQFGSIIEFWI